MKAYSLMNPMNVARLDEVFDVAHGSKLDLNKMVQCAATDEDAVLFVGRSGERNGFAAFVKKLDYVEPYPCGLITVALGGSALSSFVQPRTFYTAQNIDVLTPLTPMSLEIRLYYCLCIEANRFRYSTYGREANRTLKTLLVPSRDSLPDWVDGMKQKAVNDLCQELTFLGSSDYDEEDAQPLSRAAGTKGFRISNRRVPSHQP